MREWGTGSKVFVERDGEISICGGTHGDKGEIPVRGRQGRQERMGDSHIECGVRAVNDSMPLPKTCWRFSTGNHTCVRKGCRDDDAQSHLHSILIPLRYTRAIHGRYLHRLFFPYMQAPGPIPMHTTQIDINV